MYASDACNLRPPGSLRLSRLYRLLPFILCLTALETTAQSARTNPATQSSEDILAFRFTLAGGAVAGPTAAGGRVWIVSEDHTLYVLDDSGKAVGRRPWRDGTPAWIAPDAFGRALLPAADGSLVLVNRAGLEVCRIRPGAPVTSPPVFGADGRCFMIAGSRLLAYSAGGRLLWSSDLPAAPSLGPFARFSSSGGTIVAVAPRDGSVREYDEYGSLLWAREDRSPPAVFAALGDGLLLLYSDGRAVLRDPQGGEQARARLPGSPVAARGNGDGAWILCSGGRVVKMSGDGSVGPVIDTGVIDAQSLEVFPQRVLVLGPKGVASLSKDGEVFRNLALRNAPRLPAATTSGLILSAGEDWILYAYHFEHPLGTPFVPPPGSVDFEAARGKAAEEAFWNPDFGTDEGIMEELRHIENSVGSASIGAGEKAALEYCSALALGYGIREPSIYGGAAPQGPRPASPLPRAAACGILGMLGSPRAIPVLVEVYLHDPDPAVRAGAAQAIGEIGLDTSGEALRAFQWAADREYFLDEWGALATLNALEGIYRALGELSDPAGVRAVIKLSGKPYGSSVRTRALAVLRRLSQPAR